MSLLLWLAALPCLWWTQGTEQSAAALRTYGIERLCVPPESAEAWRAAGFTVVPMSEADLDKRQPVPAPGIRTRVDRASATRSPWINASGWRYLRDPAGRYAYDLPPGKAPLAAAEAWAYGADAVLKIEQADLASLGQMLTFLSHLPPRDLPAAADFAVVDDGSSAMGEVLNLLVRRNLLFRIGAGEDAQFRVNVRLGTPDYPAAEAKEDPSAVALKIRHALGDDQRSIRIFGTEIVIVRLARDGNATRLHLLNYGGRDLEGVRVRLKGTVPEGEAQVVGQGRLALEDRAVVEGGTEFTVPRVGPYAVVDLPAAK